MFFDSNGIYTLNEYNIKIKTINDLKNILNNNNKVSQLIFNLINNDNNEGQQLTQQF